MKLGPTCKLLTRRVVRTKTERTLVRIARLVAWSGSLTTASLVTPRPGRSHSGDCTLSVTPYEDQTRRRVSTSMKNLLRQLTTIAALLVLMVLTACSNDRLSDYSEQMNPIFQAHSDEFALADDALDDVMACAPTLNELVFTDCGTDFVVALDRYERAASVHIDKWVFELQPPDEALLFHELTLELFQLRPSCILHYEIPDEGLDGGPISCN